MSRRPDPVASRRAILEAARQCFSKKGYAGTSMHDIAAAAAVTQSLIHHHFGAKEALWTEVRAFAFGEYVAEQRKLIESSTSDPSLLRTSMEAYFHFLARSPDILRLVAWLELDRPVEFIDEIRALHENGIKVIEAGQARGQLRDDVPAKFILTAFMGLIRNWFQERHLVGVDEQTDAAYLQALWSMFSHGLGPKPPPQLVPTDEPSDPSGGAAA